MNVLKSIGLFSLLTLLFTFTSLAQTNFQKLKKTARSKIYAIDANGKIKLAPGFKFQRVSQNRGIIYNEINWTLKRVEGVWVGIRTDAASSDCDGGCPPGFSCVQGICQPLAGCEPACPPGTSCNQGICQPILSCDPPCDPGSQCEQGVCSPIASCTPPCEPGSTCHNGQCVPDSYTCDPPCPEDKTCVCIFSNCKCEDLPGDLDEVMVLE